MYYNVKDRESEDTSIIVNAIFNVILTAQFTNSCLYLNTESILLLMIFVLGNSFIIDARTRCR